FKLILTSPELLIDLIPVICCKDVAIVYFYNRHVIYRRALQLTSGFFTSPLPLIETINNLSNLQNQS
ncbi:hypothetical protein RCU70_05915, partial [Escherichia marmotae]|nr:hypothetical protein [Escherichia marmotae]